MALCRGLFLLMTCLFGDACPTQLRFRWHTEILDFALDDRSLWFPNGLNFYPLGSVPDDPRDPISNGCLPPLDVSQTSVRYVDK